MTAVTSNQIPIYRLIRQYVIELASHPDNNGKKLMSINDLCKLYNVSHPTVMRALKVLIDEEVLVTKPGVGTFIKALPTLAYSSYIKFKNIGLIVSNGKLVHYDNHYLRLNAAIFDSLSQKHQFVQFVTPTGLNGEFIKILKTLQLDGIIWVNSTSECQPQLEAIDNAGIPLVMVQIYQYDYLSKNTVVADFFQAGKLAGNYLSDNGHQKIVHLCNDYSAHECKKKNKTRDLIKGLKSAYQANGLTIDDKHFLVGGEQLLEKLEMMIDIGLKFSAVFVDGNFCLPVHDLLVKKGLRVPQDVAIVAMEDSYSIAAPFELTYIRYPLRQIGEKAGELIMNLVEKSATAPVKITVDWEIYKKGLKL